MSAEKTILQIPVSSSLRMKAEKSAVNLGFSSLQEILRVFMQKLALKTINISFTEEKAVTLSSKAEKRYAKMDKDFRFGRNVYTAKNVDELMQQLSR